MTFISKAIIYTFFISQTALSASTSSPLLSRLITDMEDQSLDDFSLIEAAFVLSGTQTLASLSSDIAWYDSLVETIEGFHLDSFDRVGSASKIFSYLHSSWLITYREESTSLLDIVKKKEYNCVAGTILYNLVCSGLGFSTGAFETPTHVYTIFTNFSQRVMVENTSPMGFDIMRNLHAYSRYLAQFYPQKKVYQIGLDKLYAYENSKGREITNLELLGLLAYNRAYFANKKNRFQSAYQFVLLAQKFNHDSRSNVDFELDLYNRWGKALFDQGNFNEAVKLFSHACDRYPYNGNFSQNFEAAFGNALIKNWHRKDWESTLRIIDDIGEGGTLSEKGFSLLHKLLIDWRRYFEFARDPEGKLQAQQLLHKYFGKN